MTEQELYTKQEALEHEYASESVLASIQSTKKAIEEGRLADIPAGKRIMAKAFDVVKNAMEECLKPRRGIAGVTKKYHGLIRRVDIDIVSVVALRHAISCATELKRYYVQDLCNSIGRLIETEAMVDAIQNLNPMYLKKTVQYLDEGHTQSFHHRRRTFQSAADNVSLGWDHWTTEECCQVGMILMRAVFETGLFVWKPSDKFSKGKSPKNYLAPTPALAAHLEDVTQAARNIIKFPPMLVKPMPRLGMHEGGYLTPWFQVRAPMITMKVKTKQHRWVFEQLDNKKADALKAAITKAQSVAYRVSKPTLSVLGQALAKGKGGFGTVPTAPLEKPPCPCDGIKPEDRTPEQLLQFEVWKEKMVAYYANEVTRNGRNIGIVNKVRELRRYQDYAELYFPAFVDWRGRLYFRSTISPQNSDAVKGCLEFANGKRLGERGLFWLKVHIANCAGYDKHDVTLRAKWTDDNLESLWDYYENPLDVEPPEPDTACTLYQALHALREALQLDNPEDYICHVPVAVDATCSGLQHFSAMLRDPVGAGFTNLCDNGTDQKSDIYTHVSGLADVSKSQYTDDPVIKEYWRDKAITRNMAKRPVMTYVYSATVISSNDYISEAISKQYEPLIDPDGKTVYSINKLAFVITKAIRASIELAVPAATNGMAYLRSIVKNNKHNALKYINPVGMPILFWAPVIKNKRINVRSMGINQTEIGLRLDEYNANKAMAGISPNFIHSCDSTHLCKTVNAASIKIIPVHDSFATHPCDVDELNRVLREQFYDMYQQDILQDFVDQQAINGCKVTEAPKKGTLDIKEVLTSRFMFC